MLSKLNETLPDSFDMRATADFVKQTTKSLKDITDDDWISMEDMEDNSKQTIMKFYATLVPICFCHKQELIVSVFDKELTKDSISPHSCSI